MRYMTDDLPCYEFRHGDTGPLPGYVALDLADGQWTWGARGTGDGIPMRQWHGHVLSFRVPAEITEDGIKAIIDDPEIQMLVIAVRHGYEDHWDGSNRVARLTDEAAIAKAALYMAVEQAAEGLEVGRGLANVWDVRDWLGSPGKGKDGSLSFGDHVIRQDTTDDDLETMADALEAMARADDVVLHGDVLDVLRDLREHLTDA